MATGDWWTPPDGFDNGLTLVLHGQLQREEAEGGREGERVGEGGGWGG